MKLYLFIAWMIQLLIVSTGKNTTESDFLVNLNSLNIKEELGHVPEPENDNEESFHGIRNRYFRVQRALETVFKRPNHGPRPVAINPGALIKDTTYRQAENVITTPPRRSNMTEPTEPTRKIRPRPTLRPHTKLTTLSRTVAKILKTIATKLYKENVTSTTSNNSEASLTTKKPNRTKPSDRNTTMKATTEKISGSTLSKDETIKILKSATTYKETTYETIPTRVTIKPNSSMYHGTTVPPTKHVPKALIQPEDFIINFLVKFDVPSKSARHNTVLNQTITIYSLL